MIYRLGRFIFRIAVFAFYRRIDVEGIENVPKTAPVIFTLNHPNALIDPVVMLIHLDRQVSLTAKSTLLKMPLVGQLMRLFQVVPIHRRQDQAEGADPAKNLESLAMCRERLASGGAICIFPEGQSHSDPQLRPLKTGAARIALEYLEQTGNKGGLQIIPTGLHFEKKEKVRSRVWIRFGKPLDPAQWKAEHPNEGAKELTAELDRRLRHETLNFEAERDSDLLAGAAEILETGGRRPLRLGADDAPLGERINLLEQLRDGYAVLRTSRAAEVDALAERITRHRNRLDALGITPHEVFLPIHPMLALGFAIRQFSYLVFLLPIALYGWINNLLPDIGVRLAGLTLARDRDQVATNVIYPGLILFPLFWAVQSYAVYRYSNLPLALIYALTPAPTGFIALHYRERARRIYRRAKTFVRFLLNNQLQHDLETEARTIIQQIQNLAAEIGQTSDPSHA